MYKKKVDNFENFDFNSINPSEESIKKTQQYLTNLKYSGLNTNREGAIAFLSLIYFMAWVHSDYKVNVVVDLNNIDFGDFTQKFFKRGLHPITDPKKILKINSEREKLKELFETIYTPSSYNSVSSNDNDNNIFISDSVEDTNLDEYYYNINGNNNIGDFDFLMENQDNMLIFRMLGNNELIFEQQCLRLRERLEEIIKKANENGLTENGVKKLLSSGIKIELLGKTGTNMWFCGEDVLPEWCIMIRALKKIVGDILERYDINYESITKIGDFVSTIDTINEADKKITKAEIMGMYRIVYIGCPNTDRRQEIDEVLRKLKILVEIAEKEKELKNLKMDNLSKKAKIEEEIKKLKRHFPNGGWSYDDCGGVEKLHSILVYNANSFLCGNKMIEDQNRTTLGSYSGFLEKNKAIRFIRVTNEFDKYYISNMFCETSKLFYTLLIKSKLIDQYKMLRAEVKLNENIENIKILHI